MRVPSSLATALPTLAAVSSRERERARERARKSEHKTRTSARNTSRLFIGARCDSPRDLHHTRVSARMHARASTHTRAASPSGRDLFNENEQRDCQPRQNPRLRPRLRDHSVTCAGATRNPKRGKFRLTRARAVDIVSMITKVHSDRDLNTPLSDEPRAYDTATRRRAGSPRANSPTTEEISHLPSVRTALLSHSLLCDGSTR